MSHPKIAIDKGLLHEKILRAQNAGTGIEDLFLLVPTSNKDGEGEIFIETPDGRLRTFFVYALSEFQRYGREFPSALLLSHKKYPYPQINKPSARAFKSIDGHESHIVN
jgi:hypothetical protein